jgi:gluconate 2-dehydrogenase gamma chain
MNHEHDVGRRGFFKTAAAASAAAALPAVLPAGDAAAQTHMHHPAAKPAGASADQPPLFFSSTEVAFMTAAVDVFIPKDDVGPGGVESGCVTYIDRQLAAGWGRGARLYIQGPFPDGAKPEQGYQLPLTPSELYRTGIADVNAWCRANRGGKTFDQLAAADRDSVLKDLQANKIALKQVPAGALVNLMLTNTMEGYFADPIYGGNRNKAVWKMIGFPGAGGVFFSEIEAYRNKLFPTDPQSIADLS